MNIIALLFLVMIAVSLLGAILAYYNGKNVAKAEYECWIDETDRPGEVRNMIAKGRERYEYDLEQESPWCQIKQLLRLTIDFLRPYFSFRKTH